MKDTTIGVVGSLGYVGKQVVNFFKDHFVVYGTDKRIPERDEEGFVGDPKYILQCDVVFVCVPTPTVPLTDGECDLTEVDSVLRNFAGMDTLIVLKSTVPPQTCEHLAQTYSLNLVFSPEFSGESKYQTGFEFGNDMRKSPWFVCGHTGGAKYQAERLAELYAEVAGPMPRYIVCPATQAELVKYWTNCWAAMKVVAAAEMKTLCQRLGVSFLDARETWGTCPWVNLMHTMVFDEPGFGGKCFPKDMDALLATAKEVGVDLSVFEAARDKNKELRT